MRLLLTPFVGTTDFQARFLATHRATAVGGELLFEIIARERELLGFIQTEKIWEPQCADGVRVRPGPTIHFNLLDLVIALVLKAGNAAHAPR